MMITACSILISLKLSFSHFNISFEVKSEILQRIPLIDVKLLVDEFQVLQKILTHQPEQILVYQQFSHLENITFINVKVFNQAKDQLKNDQTQGTLIQNSESAKKAQKKPPSNSPSAKVKNALVVTPKSQNIQFKKQKMSKNKAIQIHLRIRPHPNKYDGYKFDNEKGEIEYQIPKNDQGYVNNQREKIKFKFDYVFDTDTRQEKVFDMTAKDVVDSAIDGYNGTIFAYGQTGSGKTYTMTGGGDTDDGQGIIPRTLRYIFYLAETKGLDVKVKIRYLQIYNGTGYDLLDPSIDPQTVDKLKTLEELSKVVPMQGPNGEIVLQNIHTHLARNQEDAMGLLLIGDTNRITCRTPKNDESTRSHCIFMISLETMKPGSDVKSVATINLVDLSGSERIKQTQVEGLLQREAISINLGLHVLERVIVSLNKKMKGENIHIPYRESLMTTILRDSIGGNCITRMIATMSPKEEDIMESISSCRFAQRVALIKNSIEKNEAVDPAVIIARLKRQNAQLKAQVALLKGGENKDELDKYEIEDCHKAVTQFLEDEDPTATLIMSDRLKINECFYFLKNIFKKGGKTLNANKNIENNSNAMMVESGKGKMNNREDDGRFEDQIKKLKLAIQSRDNQITLLLSLIHKKRGNNEPLIPVKRGSIEEEQMMNSVIKAKPMEFMKEEDMLSQISKEDRSQSKIQSNNWVNPQSESKVSHTNMSSVSKKLDRQQVQKMLIKPLNLTNQDLLDHAKAFEAFRVSSRRHEAIQKNADVLKQKMKQGKEMATDIHQSRERIGKLKTELEDIRRQNAVKNLVDGNDQQDPEEYAIRQQMVKAKERYKQTSQKLKGLKLEIENIQILQKKNADQLQKDFLKYVTLKQQERQNTIASVDSSILASNIRDQEVQKHLESFLKAKEQIRRK